MTENIEKCYDLIKSIEYCEDIPKEAIDFAKNNNLIIIMGVSNELMCRYGSKSYLTDYCEHSFGWNGNLLNDISDKKLENEARQLGLEIFWCGEIKNNDGVVIKSLPNYSIEKNGKFFYTVKDGINFKNFIVNDDETKIYCTGIIIELPKNFIREN